jgi:triacylglycerol lipase
LDLDPRVRAARLGSIARRVSTSTLSQSRLFAEDAVNIGRTVSKDVTAIRRTVGRAMRRPATYPGFIKEVAYASFNLAFYPAGLVGEALKVSDEVRLGDRYTPQTPLAYLAPEAAATPVILLHGYFHNRSAFVVMRRALKRFGFRHVDSMNYNVIGHDIAELAAELSEHVDEVLERAGGTKVHLVGHSLGGLVARYYIQRLGGAEKVHSCITLGTPHRGTYAALVGRGRAARQLRPGSPLITGLARSARQSSVRYVAFYSNLDPMVLPAAHAKITEPALRARNILIKDHGHISLLISRPLIRSVAEILCDLDHVPASSTVTEIHSA